MKPKLLYCLSLIGVLFILSFTVIQRESKNSCLVACNKVEEAAGEIEDSAVDFIFMESLTKYLVFSLKR